MEPGSAARVAELLGQASRSTAVDEEVVVAGGRERIDLPSGDASESRSIDLWREPDLSEGNEALAEIEAHG